MTEEIEISMTVKAKMLYDSLDYGFYRMNAIICELEKQNVGRGGKARLCHVVEAVIRTRDRLPLVNGELRTTEAYREHYEFNERFHSVRFVAVAR